MICSRDQEKINVVKKEIEDIAKIEVLAVKADLNSEEDIKNLYIEAKKKFQSIDILINNNGGPPPSTFEQLNDEDWKKAFNATMLSAIRLSKLVLPEMKKKQ